MSGITAVDRQLAWNIKILTCPPMDICKAGAFQLWEQPFLCWQDLFNDLILCFDLKPYLASDKELVLWIRNSDQVVCDLPNPWVSYTTESDSDRSKILSQFIQVGNVSGVHDDDLLQTQLHLSVVLHNNSECKCKDSSLDFHMRAGCIISIDLRMNPESKYFPIPGPAGTRSIGSSTPPSPRVSPTKRSRPESLHGGSTPRAGETPRYKYVPPELELNVKGMYNGTCVITGNNYSWGSRMVAGPGIEACHIIPKSFYLCYPNQQLSEEGRWNAVNSYNNCMAMDSACHKIHDNRLLAVHHVTKRIRLFAPVPTLCPRNNQQAFFPNTQPFPQSLEWHYNLTVMENMLANFLDQDGGAKRMPWLRTLGPLSANDDENNVPAGSDAFGSLAPNRTRTGAGLSNAADREAPHGPVEDFRFATRLCDLLEAEAWRQEQREQVEAWSLSQQLHSQGTSQRLPIGS